MGIARTQRDRRTRRRQHELLRVTMLAYSAVLIPQQPMKLHHETNTPEQCVLKGGKPGFRLSPCKFAEQMSVQ